MVKDLYQGAVYYFADVTDCGEYYSVNWVMEFDRIALDIGTTYVRLTEVAKEEVSTALKNGMLVKIYKPLKNPIMIENEVGLVDIEICEPDSFHKRQACELIKLRSNMDNLTSFFFAYDFFEFTIANNYLNNKGYFITDKNREEKYIEIINTGDIELISYLENYLNKLDRLSIPYFQYNHYKELYYNVYKAKTHAELDALLEEYYKKLYNK